MNNIKQEQKYLSFPFLESVFNRNNLQENWVQNDKV